MWLVEYARIKFVIANEAACQVVPLSDLKKALRKYLPCLRVVTLCQTWRWHVARLANSSQALVDWLILQPKNRNSRRAMMGPAGLHFIDGSAKSSRWQRRRWRQNIHCFHIIEENRKPNSRCMPITRISCSRCYSNRPSWKENSFQPPWKTGVLALSYLVGQMLTRCTPTW